MATRAERRTRLSPPQAFPRSTSPTFATLILLFLPSLRCSLALAHTHQLPITSASPTSSPSPQLSPIPSPRQPHPHPFAAPLSSGHNSLETPSRPRSSYESATPIPSPPPEQAPPDVVNRTKRGMAFTVPW